MYSLPLKRFSNTMPKISQEHILRSLAEGHAAEAYNLYYECGKLVTVVRRFTHSEIIALGTRASV